MDARQSGHMHWEISDWCNYACSYCCEGRFAPRKTARRHVSQAGLVQMERFLSTLENGWTVRLSAGEPSSHPRLYQITEMIMRSGHQVAMESNLSLPLERYARFVALAGKRLAYLHASLHFEHANRSEFLAKCLALRDAIARSGGPAQLYVASVATTADLGRLQESIALFAREGLPIHLQRPLGHRDGGSMDAHLAAVQDHLERPAASGDSPSGRPCAAGKRWLLVDMNGNVWRCHAGRAAWHAARPNRIVGGFLGSIGLGVVALHARARPCPFPACACPGRPVPDGSATAAPSGA